MSDTQTTPNNVGETPGGHLVGVEPAKPRMAGDWSDMQGVQPPPQQGQQSQQPLQQPTPQQPTQQGRVWTEDEVQAMQEAERQRFAQQLEAVQGELAEIRRGREEEEAERIRLAEEAEAERKQREEAELDARSLLERREAEWNERFTTLEQQAEQRNAIYEQERRLAEVETYRAQRLEQDGEYILPELRGYIGGNSIEEIDQAIERAKEHTSQIMSNIQGAIQQQQPAPFQQRVASPTSPPMGPMEQQGDQIPVSATDIASMPMEEYKRNRQQYLQLASRAYQSGR